MVERISKDVLFRLLKGDVGEDAVCVVKFYSNGCHLCHALKFTYEKVSQAYEEREGIYFFAFNIGDADDLSRYIKVDGTPSICAIHTGDNKRVDVLQEPVDPDPQTWYTEKDIEKFVTRAIR